MCVKLLREASGCGLAEAKAWVDALSSSSEAEEAAIGQRLEQERAASAAASTAAALAHEAALRAARAMALAPELLELAWRLSRAREKQPQDEAASIELARLDLALLQWPGEQVKAALLLSGEMAEQAVILCDVARLGWSEEDHVDFNLRQLCPGFSEAAYGEALASAWESTR
jgi:hypothetical protein